MARRAHGLAVTLVLAACGAIALRAAHRPAAVAQTVVPAPSQERPAPARRAEPPLPAEATAIASYTLEASLDPVAHVVDGRGTIRWRNASRTLQRELWLHLYLNAWKTERTVFNRTPASGFRGGGSAGSGRIDVTRMFARELQADLWEHAEHHTPGDPDDETDVRLVLPREVGPGETLTLEVAWKAHLPAVVLRTGHHGSFHLVGQWFPKLARLEPDGTWAHFPFHRLSEFYADYGTYDVTIDVPAGFVVGATGERVSHVERDGRTISRFVQSDVHDFAFAAWDEFRTKTVESDGVSIRCLYPPGYEAAADVEIAAARWGLSWFGDAYGAYPYRTLTIVHPPPGAEEAGGMEYPTMITTGGSWALPWSGVRALEVVTIHELGHQWFYGLVATNENAHPFLDEGVNSFAETDAMEALHPGASAASVLGLRVGLPAAHRISSLRAPRDAVVARKAPDFPAGADYGALVYSKTATALTTLARTWGAERVRAAIGLYARRHRFGHPKPEDLFAAVEEVVGAEAATALRAALVEGAWVDFSAEEPPWSRAEGSVWRAETLVRRAGSLRIPVDVDLVGEDGTVQRVRWDGAAASARFAWEGSSPLAAVIVDPEHRVLLDVDLSNNGRRVTPTGSARTMDRFGFVTAVLAHLLLP